MRLVLQIEPLAMRLVLQIEPLAMRLVLQIEPLAMRLVLQIEPHVVVAAGVFSRRVILYHVSDAI